MDQKQAAQIANLINERNKLVKGYTTQDIYDARDNYLFELAEDGEVTGCAELSRVQWYQFEIKHLSVSSKVEGKGVGWTLFKRAEKLARDGRGRILQCTIRENNKESQQLFERNGFVRVSEFYYPDSGNNVLFSPMTQEA